MNVDGETGQPMEDGEVSPEALEAMGLARLSKRDSQVSTSSTEQEFPKEETFFTSDGETEVHIKYTNRHGKNHENGAVKPGDQSKLDKNKGRSNGGEFTYKPERLEKPFCRYHFIHGNCDYNDSCRFSHGDMRDQNDLNKFFRDNEGYLIEQYKESKLSRLLYHFHQFLKKRIEEDPSYTQRWTFKLKEHEPPEVSLNTALHVNLHHKRQSQPNTSSRAC